MISNEVLAEKIEGFTRQTIAESRQVRSDLSHAIEEMGRVKDAITTVADKLTLHEQLGGHPISMLKIGLLEKDSEKFTQELGQLRELLVLKADVAQLKLEMAGVQSVQSSAQSYDAGRKSALTGAEKVILLTMSSIGPILLLIERL